MVEDKTTVYNMDCMDYMAGLPDNAFDLAIVDPPYGINESGQTNKTRGDLATAKDYGNKVWDRFSPDDKYFKQLFRVSKAQIVWGANHFISKISIDSSCWIVWDKENRKTHFADCELAWTSFKSSVRKFNFNWNGMWQGDMKNKEVRIHPTQKPVALYKWLLQNYAKPGEKILDTHLGSGSSRIAAYDMDFEFVGMEIDEDYFKAQEERFAKHKQQLRLM